MTAGAGFSLAHKYSTAAHYVVKVVICDDDGGCGTDEFAVTVTDDGGPELPPTGSNLDGPLMLALGLVITGVVLRRRRVPDS